MNSELRLAETLTALDQLGLSYLVMGRHAARYSGVSRNTPDYDLCVSLSRWSNLEPALRRSEYFARLPLEEGPSSSFTLSFITGLSRVGL